MCRPLVSFRVETIVEFETEYPVPCLPARQLKKYSAALI